MPETLPDDWDRWRRSVDVGTYDDRWDRIAARGGNPHGEADLVTALLTGVDGPLVLDGGCGTGRVGIELARRGVGVEGLDPDADMIGVARAKAPELTWRHGGLQEIDDDARFDLVVLAGNVVPYVVAPQRPAAVAGCARALRRGGLLVAGFSLQPGWPGLPEYDTWCADAGLVLDDRFATWDRAPYVSGGDYAVSVHRRD
ncbi:bifunctional 2-polyprenyl-6-hydroxyphenol methylase/3-demethylubiquinol 3-O-methyltransferase UbiG [Pseudonocardia sp. N23]|uniref:class I SAM-dependent methyltransferase n=1 Tax=Pseudonocardia sp. N23 TaxID=1987376 RepID=UPI000BFC4570|nr:class I SAM-dependent methyltransferase [Pseudonocardia sp. N23]